MAYFVKFYNSVNSVVVNNQHTQVQQWQMNNEREQKEVKQTHAITLFIKITPVDATFQTRNHAVIISAKAAA